MNSKLCIMVYELLCGESQSCVKMMILSSVCIIITRNYIIFVTFLCTDRNLDKSDRASKILIDFFFLDYNVIVEFKMSFVTKTAYLPRKILVPYYY